MSYPKNARFASARLLLLFALALANVVSADDKPLFDLAVQGPTAKPGDYVLCPSRAFVERAQKAGPERQTFIYYAAKMAKPGERTSTVRSLSGRTAPIPNQLIISIPRGETAKVGDIVLTWWQSGSGMQRAIVTGGTPTTPMVRYLDITYENPTGVAKKDALLKPNSFVVLKQPWQIGSTVKIQSGRRNVYGQIVALSSNKVLVREFAGRLKLYARKDASPLPLRPELSKNQAAQAALFGSLRPVTVLRIDHRIGRVFASYQLGRTTKEKAFAFGDIIPE